MQLFLLHIVEFSSNEEPKHAATKKSLNSNHPTRLGGFRLISFIITILYYYPLHPTVGCRGEKKKRKCKIAKTDFSVGFTRCLRVPTQACKIAHCFARGCGN